MLVTVVGTVRDNSASPVSYIANLKTIFDGRATEFEVHLKDLPLDLLRITFTKRSKFFFEVIVSVNTLLADEPAIKKLPEEKKFILLFTLPIIADAITEMEIYRGVPASQRTAEIDFERFEELDNSWLVELLKTACS